MIRIGYRPDIDGMRAVAVLSVLFYHASFGFSGGFVGVDVFFVISGFLITGLIRKEQHAGTFRLTAFWGRRIRRIIPAATVMVAVTLAAGLFFLLPTDLVDLAESAISQQLMISNIYFWQHTSYFEGPAEIKPLLHTWSLGVEEQFYLGFPFLLVLLGRRNTRFIFLTLASLALAAFAISEWGVRHHQEAAFFLLPTRMWELLLGSLLVFIPAPAGSNRTWREASSWTGLACVLAAGCFFNAATGFPGVAALLPCVGSALMIYANANGPTSLGRLLSTKILVFIGLISYSLYLWHWPILAYLHYLYGPQLSLASRLGAVAASFVCAYASWRFVETPFRRGFPQLSIRHAALAAAGAAVVLVSAARWIEHEGGLPSRLPGDIYDSEGNDALDLRFEMDTPMALRGEFPPLGVEAIEDQAIDFLVWGDSHAFAVGNLLDALAKDHNQVGVLAARPGITPLLGVFRRGAGTVPLDWNEAVLSFVREQNIHRVFLVSRWAVNIEGRPNGRLDSLISDRPGQPTPELAREVLRRGLERTVAALGQLGVEVWIVKQVPLQAEDSRAKVVQVAFFQREYPKGVTLREHQARQLHANVIIDAVVAEHDRAHSLDPGGYCFNAQGHCPIIVEGKRLFLDVDHLSSDGAEYFLRPMFDPVFRSRDAGTPE